MSRMRLLLLGIVVGGAVGCEGMLGFEDFEAARSTQEAGAVACTVANAPASMVGRRLPNGACVWVDQWEVSRSRYESVIAGVNLSVNGDPALCPDKKSSADLESGCSGQTGELDAGDGSLPVTCVDWCDAHIFCRADGKRLCRDDFASPVSAATSDWYALCSADGKRDYPYGASADPSVCNNSDNPTFGCNPNCLLSPTNQLNACKADSDVYDLIGNVAEWTDACNSSSASAECRLRGGGVNKSSQDSSCSSVETVPRGTRAAFFGFRCCWQP